jgi:hypothetical protein
LTIITSLKPQQQAGSRYYPTPSPAACGSRKQAELAVAELLAAAAATQSPTSASASGYLSHGAAGTQYRGGDAEQHSNYTTELGSSLRITNPDDLGGRGGRGNRCVLLHVFHCIGMPV